MEDIIHYFDKSELNQSSKGMLGKILDMLLSGTASSFYNSIGANMKEGQSISSYMDELEKELFEECGVDIPTDEELKAFINNEEGEHQEEFDEEFEDEYNEEDEKESGDYAKYREMDSALPNEGEIDQIKDLPFSNDYTKIQ